MDFLTTPSFGVTSAEVAIICPGNITIGGVCIYMLDSPDSFFASQKKVIRGPQVSPLPVTGPERFQLTFHDVSKRNGHQRCFFGWKSKLTIF